MAFTNSNCSSPTRKRKQTKINFTYKQSQINSSSQISISEEVRLNDLRAINIQPHSSNNISHILKLNKIWKNKLCSLEFSFTYNPLEEIKRKGKQLQKLLSQLRAESDILSSRTSVNCERVRDSNVTSAQTMISAMAKINKSQLTSEESYWRNSFQSKNQQPFKIEFSSSTLMDRIAPSKQLGKTIMFPARTYDFGGLIATKPQGIFTAPNLDRNSFKGPVNASGQLKGLLTEERDEDLKESIHCGPDVHANRFNCEMLKGFGREIQQSSMSFRE